MTSAEENFSPAETDQPLPTAGPAVSRFVRAFEDRLGSMYDSGGAIEDMQASVRLDLAEDLERGDLKTAQADLEHGRWENRLGASLNAERRDALAELHVAEKGEPGLEQRNAAWQTTQKAVLDRVSSLEKQRRDSGDSPAVNPYIDVPRTLFEARGSSEDLDEAISFIEGLITEEAVLDPSGTKIEDLRIARDRFHQDYKFKHEIETNQQEFTGRLLNLVGKDNEQFPAPTIAQATNHLIGFSAENMRQVLAAAEATADSYDKMDLIHGLMRDSIPIRDEAAFAEWQQRRAELAQRQETRQQARQAVQARDAVVEAHERREES